MFVSVSVILMMQSGEFPGAGDPGGGKVLKLHHAPDVAKPCARQTAAGQAIAAGDEEGARGLNKGAPAVNAPGFHGHAAMAELSLKQGRCLGGASKER